MELTSSTGIDFDAERAKLENAFEMYYFYQYEYHNFNHPVEVASDTIHDIEYCEANGVEFSDDDILQLLAEAYSHDLGIYWPLSDLSIYSSFEDRSATLTPGILQVNGYDLETIGNPAGELVRVTQLGTVCAVDDELLTIKHKIVRRSDMGNLGKDYDFFSTKVVLNWLEFQRTHPEQKDIKFDDWWFTKARQVVFGLVLEEDLAYGDFDRETNGFCGFQNRCLQNVQRLDNELLKAA